jgi:hypothetical protein
LAATSIEEVRAMTEFVPDSPKPGPAREMDTGVPPAELDDQDLSHHLDSLDRTAQDIREHGSPQAEEHHEARTRELAAELEWRGQHADSVAGGAVVGHPTATGDDIRVLAKSTSEAPVLVLAGGRLVVMDAEDAHAAGGRIVYSKERLVADAGTDITDIEAELVAGRITAALADVPVNLTSVGDLSADERTDVR